MTNRIEWLKARQKGIGGSDVAAILGINPYRTPLDIYREKTTEITEDRAPSEAAYWGTQLESIVAQEFSKRTGFMIQRVYHQLASNLDHYIGTSTPTQWALANIDRAVINHRISADVRLTNPASIWNVQKLMLTTDTLLECKTANALMAEHWGLSQEAEIIKREITSKHKIPLYYETQVQWYMAVTAAKLCYVAVLIGGQDFRIYAVDRDPDVFDMIREKVRAFWLEHVEKHVPPEPISVADVRALYAKDSGAMREAARTCNRINKQEELE